MIQRDDVGATLILSYELGLTFERPFSGFLLLDAKGVSGALILNNFDGNNVHVTVANKRPMSVRNARELARLCFVDLNCVRITARTRPSNGRACRGLQALGFQLEGVARQHFRDEDAMLYGLLRDEQRLIRI